MASNTSIEWTESTWSQLFEALFQLCRDVYIFGFNPRENIFVLLRWIASSTSENNVLKFGVATLSNWYDVVKGRSRRVAISAFSIKLYQNLRLNFGRNWLAFSLAAISVLSSCASVCIVSRVSNSGIFSFVRSAQSALDYELRTKPLAALATPTQALLRHQTTFTNPDAICFGFVVAISAFAFQPVKTRTIISEIVTWFPLLAIRAFFQACFGSLQIFFNRYSGFLGRAFYRSVFRLRHNLSCFGSLNFNTRRCF